MIIYGTKIFNKILGYFGLEHECENCHKKIYSRLLKSNRWIHIMFIPLIPIGAKYKKICPYCFKQEDIKRKEAKELMEQPDNSGQSIDAFILHHANNKTGYEIWVINNNTQEKKCVLNNLNRTQINNFKKNMGLKNIKIEEVE